MNVSRMRLFVVACLMLLLSIMPLPMPLGLCRPLWIMSFVLYLQFTLPKRCRVSLLLLLGLSLDALGAGLIGQQAFALLLTAWVASKRAQRFRLFSILQQILGVGVLGLIYTVSLAFIERILGYTVSVGSIIFPVVMTMLIWPWLEYFGDRLFFRRRLKTA